jgi:hypothetical protein
MTIIIQNYVTWAFNENAYYGNLYQETSLIVTPRNELDIDDAVLTKFRKMYHLGKDDIAYLAYEIIDCGMKEDKEWYKVAVRYITEEDFWAADRRRKNVLYG